jgi:hypothetical protein
MLGRDIVLEGRITPVLLTGRTWTLTGQDTDGTTYNGSTLVFTQQTTGSSGLALDGYFDWIGSSGISGRELFHGSLTANETALELQGYDLVNPNGIVTAHYNATLAANGSSIVNGTWDGPSVVPGTWSATAPAPTNTPPTISDIPDQPPLAPGSTVGPLSFTVGDAETPAANLTLSVTSSNTALVPTNKVAFGGAGASRTVAVTPTPGQTGSAVITVTVTDGGGLTASDPFTLAPSSRQTANSSSDRLPPSSLRSKRTFGPRRRT